MRIFVGSINPVKVSAVADLISQYPFLAGSTVEGVAVESGVGKQPLSLEETVTGAMNRARALWGQGDKAADDLFVGIESGLMVVGPRTPPRYLDVCACYMLDRRSAPPSLGLSSAFEAPLDSVTDALVKRGLDYNEAMVEAGITTDAKVGYDIGASGLFTKGRFPRKMQTQEAVRNALIRFEWLAERTSPRPETVRATQTCFCKDCRSGLPHNPRPGCLHWGAP